jgi:hypothetical protein
LIRFNTIAFGADSEDAQRRRAEPAENWNPLKQLDVILDGHGGRDHGTSL